jgi:hypothetical protein
VLNLKGILIYTENSLSHCPVKEKLLKKRLQTLSVEKNFQMDSILESAIHNLNNVSVEELDQSRTLVDEDI